MSGTIKDVENKPLSDWSSFNQSDKVLTITDKKTEEFLQKNYSQYLEDVLEYASTIYKYWDKKRIKEVMKKQQNQKYLLDYYNKMDTEIRFNYDADGVEIVSRAITPTVYIMQTWEVAGLVVDCPFLVGGINESFR